MNMEIPADLPALRPYRHILVAFSGGLDSTVLLHKLVCWRRHSPDIHLRAIHIHHGLSPNADDWVAHCQHWCSKWQVPLLVRHVTVADDGLGIEAQARLARYDAFRETLLPGEVLATAQHQDDQCETLLLALKRGSGPAGLSAMPESMAFAGTRLIRPLLNASRSTLLSWATAHQLSWIEDESNQDDHYDRNFLRLRVLPLLSARWPHFAQAVSRSATLCGEQEQLLDELLADDLAAHIGAQGQLAIAPLLTLSAPRRAALLRRWLSRHKAVMPSRDMLCRVWQEVALAREDAKPQLQLGTCSVRRYQQQLWWVRNIPEQGARQLCWPDISQPLVLADSLGIVQLQPGGNLRSPRADELVSIRFQAPGLLHIVGRHGGRKLKKIWQESGVPPWWRNATPLLFYNETLIAAAEQFVTQEGQCGEEEKGLVLVWQKNGQ